MERAFGASARGGLEEAHPREGGWRGRIGHTSNPTIFSWQLPLPAAARKAPPRLGNGGGSV